MKKKYFIFLLCVLLLCGLVLVVFDSQRKNNDFDTYIFKEQDTSINLKNTSWEFVQYTEGSKVNNLVGTDWVLQFGENSGVVRMCSTQKFGFTSNFKTIDVELDYIPSALCSDNSARLENLFFSVLQKKPEIQITTGQGSVSKVLSIISGTTKFSFIPHERLDSLLLSHDATTKKGISINALYRVCIKKDPCTSEPFKGTFTVKDITLVESSPINFSTNETGEVSLELPFGTYQVDLKDETKKYSMNPIIFSTTTNLDHTQIVELLVTKK